MYSPAISAAENNYFSNPKVAKKLISSKYSTITAGFVAEKLVEKCDAFSNRLKINHQKIIRVKSRPIGDGHSSTVLRSVFSLTPSTTVNPTEAGLQIAAKETDEKQENEFRVIVKISIRKMYSRAAEMFFMSVFGILRSLRVFTRRFVMYEKFLEMFSVWPAAMEELSETIHNGECEFYDLVARWEAERKQKFPFPLPTVFYTQRLEDDQPGLILMEDLSTQCHHLPFIEATSERKAIKIIEAFASLHSTLLEMDENSWQPLFQTRHSQMEGKNAEGILKKNLVEMFDQYERRYGPQIRRFKKVFSPPKSGEEPRMMKFDRIYEEELRLPMLLIHGDFYTNNILWKNDADDEIAAIIDCDFARLFTLSMDTEVRRWVEAKLIEEYLKNVTSEKARAILQPEKLERAYRLALIDQGLFAMLILPVLKVFVRGEQFKKERTFSLSLEQKEAVSRMEDRIRGIMEDCAAALAIEAPELLSD